MIDGKVQHHDAQQRPGQRQDDPEEDADGRAAVDGGGFLHLLGDGQEERTADDAVVHAERAQNDQHQPVVVQPQVFNQQEAGNQAAGEVHGDHEENRQHLASGQLVLGQHIARRDGDRQIQQCAKHHVKHCVEETGHQVLILKDMGIACKGDLPREEHDLAGGDQLRIAHRIGDHQHQRVGDHQQEQEGDAIDHDIEQFNTLSSHLAHLRTDWSR